MFRTVRKFLDDDSGQDLLEYSLVLLAVASGALAGNGSLAADFLSWRGIVGPRITSMINGG